MDRSLRIQDILAVNNLQTIQEAFAAATGVASVITDLEGNFVTRPSNFSDVCLLIRGTPEGARRCMESDRLLGDASARMLRPTYQRCLSCGFVDASAPIVVSGRHIGNWRISQNAMGAEREQVRAYAESVGAPADLVLASYDRLPSANLASFTKTLDLLWIMAGNLSSTAYANVMLARELEARKRNEKKYRMLFDRMNDPFALFQSITDADGNPIDSIYLEVNPSYEKLTCRPGPSIVGRTYRETWPTSDDIWEQTISLAARTGEPVHYSGYFTEVDRHLRALYFVPQPGQVAALFADISERVLLEENLRNISSELVLAEERTRREISLDLHDGIGHALVAIKRKIRDLERWERDPAKRESYTEIRTIVDSTIDQTRTMTSRLSPPLLYDLGLTIALKALAEDIFENTDARFRVMGNVKPLSLPVDIRVTLYQIVRELLFNIYKHSGASRFVVLLFQSETRVRVRVRDNGVGFRAEELKPKRRLSSGRGLFSIRERLTHFGGSLDIESAPGKGTSVTVTLPVRPKGGDLS